MLRRVWGVGFISDQDCGTLERLNLAARLPPRSAAVNRGADSFGALAYCASFGGMANVILGGLQHLKDSTRLILRHFHRESAAPERTLLSMTARFTTICPTCGGHTPSQPDPLPHPHRAGALAVVLTSRPCTTCGGDGNLGEVKIPV